MWIPVLNLNKVALVMQPLFVEAGLSASELVSFGHGIWEA